MTATLTIDTESEPGSWVESTADLRIAAVTPEIILGAIEMLEDGQLIWRTRTDALFVSDRGRRKWNTQFSGKPITPRVMNNGYASVRISRVDILLHRLLWVLWTGSFPKDCLDHINGDRLDNRRENLREVDIAENAKNMRLRQGSSSGAAGVTWYSARKKWQVRITDRGQKRNLGYFKDLDEAIAVRRRAESLLGFSERHGRPSDSSTLESFGRLRGAATVTGPALDGSFHGEHDG